jgi:hypothetical protein
MPSFLPHLLAAPLEDPRRLADQHLQRRADARPQRAQIHVRAHRSVHAIGRPARDLLRLPGFAWLREIRWPVASAPLDSEAAAVDGSEGIHTVFEARTQPGSPRAFAAFEFHELHGRSLV